MSCLASSILCARSAVFNRLVPATYCESVRWKHYNPKFKWHRGKKFIKIKLPDFQEREKANNWSPEELRQKMKERGLLPGRQWIERPISISCTGATQDPYVPPEGDGKLSAVTAGGMKQTVTKFGKQSKSYMAIRKVKTYEEDFDQTEFAQFAQDIYVKAHESLAKNDLIKLHEYATEKAHDDMTWNVDRKTIRWSFLKSIEPPRVVQARVVEMMSKENLYAQLTVRLHTQQTLAIYDRFGRLEYGSEVIAKDVLEYIVFEKHLVNEYGIWRIHDKIIPPWVDNKTPLERTFRKPDSVEQLEEQVQMEEEEKRKRLPRIRAPEQQEAISS